jgi:hypothetical protein
MLFTLNDQLLFALTTPRGPATLAALAEAVDDGATARVVVTSYSVCGNDQVTRLTAERWDLDADGEPAERWTFAEEWESLDAGTSWRLRGRDLVAS